MFHRVCLTKHAIQFSYIVATFENKNKALTVETRNLVNKVLIKKKTFSFFSGHISEISIVSLFLDVSKILWKNPRSCT